MAYAYLEPSVINHCVDGHDAPAKIRAKLDAMGLTPVVGMHVVYELAITFLKPQNHDRGRLLFTFLRDLDPSYSPPSGDLLAQEITRLRTGAAVLPFLSHINQAAARLEVARLARGDFDDRARSFIGRREAGIREVHPAAMAKYIAHVNRLYARAPTAVDGLRTEDALFAKLTPVVPSMVRAILRDGVSLLEARELALRLSEFPALRATVYGNLGLMLTCIVERVPPGHDKHDDYRHVIEAAYCDVLVTDDAQLLAKTSVLHPKLTAVSRDQVLMVRARPVT